MQILEYKLLKTRMNECNIYNNKKNPICVFFKIESMPIKQQCKQILYEFYIIFLWILYYFFQIIPTINTTSLKRKKNEAQRKILTRKTTTTTKKKLNPINRNKIMHISVDTSNVWQFQPSFRHIADNKWRLSMQTSVHERQRCTEHSRHGSPFISFGHSYQKNLSISVPCTPTK